MNLYLLNLVGKWIGILFVAGTSFFGGYQEKEITVTNTNKNMSLNLTTEIIIHESVIQYNNQKPNGEKTILVQGEDGYLVRNNDNGEARTVKDPVTEVIEVGTYVAPTPIIASGGMTGEAFIGKLTVYYNCPNKSVCRTSAGHDLKSSVYYNDATYGQVRVLSAAQTKFKVGTIMEVTGTAMGSFYGIVLDWGGSMVSAWKNGKVWVDLAIDPAAEPAMAKYSSNNVNFNVKRWGF